MRITTSMRHAMIDRALRRSSQDVYTTAAQASTGLRVTRPGDDPAAYASITNKDGQIAKLESRIAASTRAVSDWSLAESSLASAGEILIRAREIATQMADESYATDSRITAAEAVQVLRGELAALANTKGTRGYLFAGTATTTRPFDSMGTFSGNDGVISLEVADGVTMRANTSGAEAFTTAGGVDVFQALYDLETALAADDPAAVHGMLDTLTSAHDQLVYARADAGTQLGQVDATLDVSESTLLTIREARAGEAEIDAIEAYQAFTTAQGAYERGLSVMQRLMNMASAADHL